MLIKYQPKVEHIKCIPLIPDPKDPKSYNRSMIQLLPGTNEITDDEWDAIQPHIVSEIKNKEIVQLVVESKKAKDGKARKLSEVPANIARDLISKCSNPATLQKWFKEETRDEVLLAVTKRMRKLKLDPDEIQKDIEKEDEEAQGDDLTDDTDTTSEEDDDDTGDGEGGNDEDDLTDDDEDDPDESN